MVNPMAASGFGVTCTKCREPVIAPYWSQFVCQEQVRHFWICEACGHQFDTAVELGLSSKTAHMEKRRSNQHSRLIGSSAETQLERNEFLVDWPSRSAC
jgi:hypothetical protein